MAGKTVCNITFAGGSCGMTMVRAGEKLTDLCEAENLRVNIKYIDLWVSDYLMPNTDLVIEMFPYYKNLSIPVVNGRPFIGRQGEQQLYTELVDMVRNIQNAKQS
jgi:hypothetical protein